MFPASGSATFGVFGGLNTTSDTLPTSFLDDSYVFSAEGLSWEPLKIGELRRSCHDLIRSGSGLKGAATDAKSVF
jgi:hypothetical protein